jgi:hypothetical protein
VIRAAAVFLLLTVVMTWPQAARLATDARDHHDVYFNLWRLRWVAHALANSPAHLFDGNIFHPEPGALTMSDAMLVEGVAGAPLLWAGLPPVLVHNVLLLGAIVMSALGMFALVRHLTRSEAAGLIAGMVFAFVPYRFEHYMHMELQWTMWIPWAFWALDRTLATGLKRYGVFCGLFIGLQMLSSIYYGIFLALLLGVASLLLLLPLRRRELTRALAALALGGVVAVAICGAYAIPYLDTRQKVGSRPDDQIATFSARPSSYLVATPDNKLYGRMFQGRGTAERRLFTGFAALILAFGGLLLRRPSNTAIAYLIALVVAFEMSLGVRSYIYTFLHAHVPVFEGLRAPARLGIFVVFFLAALAAFGYATVEAILRPFARRVLVTVGIAVLLAEYWVAPLTLVSYPNTPPPLYDWLARQPPGIVAEIPMPIPHELAGADAEHAYMSTFHWKPIVNGYSGYFPPSYLHRLDRMRDFPDASSFSQLLRDGVRYIVVHPDLYLSLIPEPPGSMTSPGSPRRADDVIQALSARTDMIQLGRFETARGEAFVYRIR